MRCLAGVLLASGCLSSSSTTCTSGDLTWVCPSGYACAGVGAYCGLTVQVDACAGKSAFDSCTFTDQSSDTVGTCELGVCNACQAATEADLEGCTYAGWLGMTSATTSPLRGVWVIDRADVYAVGDQVIQHYDGKQWSIPAEVPTFGFGADMSGVWASSDTDVFVSASGTANLGGDILHFDGTAWTVTPGPSTETMFAVAGTAANHVIAVGIDPPNGVIREFDGTTWTVADSTPGPLSTVWTSATRSLAGGGSVATGVIKRSDAGGAWTVDTLPSGTPRIQGLWGSADTDLWAVGHEHSGALQPIILHSDGSTSWALLPLCPDANATMCIDAPQADATLTAVWGTAANDIYAVGDTGAIFHFDGSRWSQQPLGAMLQVNLSGIGGALSSATDVFAVGAAGTVLRRTTP